MLSEKWQDKRKKYAFGGVDRVYKNYLGAIPKKKIEYDLAENSTYTLHKESKKVINYNPFFIYNRNDQFQSDVMYLPKAQNKAFRQKYLLVTIDVFSRKVFVKILKNKSADSVLQGFKETLEYVGEKPKSLYVDRGTEYTNKKFKKFCKDSNIKLSFSYSDTKACFAERSQRSLQDILYRMLEANQTYKFIPLIRDVVKIYNNRVNRITGFAPNKAYLPENSLKVRTNLEKYYSRALSKRKKPRFKKGDTVRVSLKKKAFDKGYFAKFTEEVFTIKEVLTNLPQPRYIIETSEKETIKGTFYERELTLARHSVFKIEKILRERRKNGKKQYFVKWMNYPDSQNSWVDEDWVSVFERKNGSRS